MRDVYVIGVGMNRFGKHLTATVKGMAAEAVQIVLRDAGIDGNMLQAAYVSNTFWGMFSNQHSIRGQVLLRPLGIQGIPIVNTENACAGASTAFHLAYLGIAAGAYDLVLALGVEKISHENKALSLQSYASCIDVEKSVEQINTLMQLNELYSPQVAQDEPGRGRSIFMDIYASVARWHMAKYGSTQKQLAVIAAKNHFHGSLNPLAQIQRDMTVEEVLADPPVSYPLTRAMCSPVGDGAAAAVLCSGDFLKKLTGARPVKILASVLGSGQDRPIDGEDIGERLSRRAYQIAGLGPQDIDLAELHDATAFGELHQLEAMGFCPPGEGGIFSESGATRLGGKLPVNTSGGLESRGHPIGASGLAQVHEVVTQLRGEAGQRQVVGARIGMTENGGGNIGYEEAAMTIHIFESIS
ncbi:thiolase family protein [Desulfotruncus alcoholivorax]|uniref:thiolase family protein n=1 Tax=Desulfotruncus alcoholivorax TaxID=265477 RepID=UPI0004149ADB|nr:thiolase family protein [Desulfotruncus alcoholivorax]